jgi:hypothetical protein
MLNGEKGVSMKANAMPLQIFRYCIGVGTLAIACGMAFSVQAQDRSEKLRRFEADRQACLSGKTSQTLDSCLKEARAVWAERPGSNPTVSSEQLQHNALLRCEPLVGEDRAACLSRTRGEGSVSGSVAGGGILRAFITAEHVPNNPQKPASSGVAN